MPIFSPMNFKTLTVISTAPYVLMRMIQWQLKMVGGFWWMYWKLKKLIVLNVLCEVQFLVCRWHCLHWRESNLQAVSFVLPCCSHARNLSV